MKTQHAKTYGVRPKQNSTKVTATNTYTEKQERSQISNLTFQLKALRTEGQTSPNAEEGVAGTAVCQRGWAVGDPEARSDAALGASMRMFLDKIDIGISDSVKQVVPPVQTGLVQQLKA